MLKGRLSNSTDVLYRGVVVLSPYLLIIYDRIKQPLLPRSQAVRHMILTHGPLVRF